MNNEQWTMNKIQNCKIPKPKSQTPNFKSSISNTQQPNNQCIIFKIIFLEVGYERKHP